MADCHVRFPRSISRALGRVEFAPAESAAELII